MLCPHCRIAFHDEGTEVKLKDSPRVTGALRHERVESLDLATPPGTPTAEMALERAASSMLDLYSVHERFCPRCGKLILNLIRRRSPFQGREAELAEDIIIWPKHINSRAPCPEAVPSNIADDYTEACLTADISPKASAALSRRCLQHVLREAAGVKASDLSREIQEVLDRNTLPSHIADSMDAVRVIGNFAAHPVKSKSTGEVQEVEPGEAEWNLDVLEAWFDFYYAHPAAIQKKRDALNQKLQDSGKPPIR